MTRNELWERLAAADVVSGAMPDETSSPTPWYVATMIGVAAWVASLFLLVFVGVALMGIVRDSRGAIVVGAILCALCAVLLRTRRNNLFVEQLAVAVSLAGQALMGYGLLENQWRSPAAWLAFAVVEVALVAGTPTYVHRVLSTFAAACAVRFALAHSGIAVLFPPLIAAAIVLAWSDASRGTRNDALWRPVIAGLALAALLIVPATIGDIFAWRLRAVPIGGVVLSWVATIALAAVLLAAVAGLLRAAGAAMQSRIALLSFASGAAVALAARPMPGLVVALVVLLIAFNDGRRALMGLAVAGMIGALVHYYQSLDATLLTKAAALFATGVVLAVAGIAVRLGLAEPEPRHA